MSSVVELVSEDQGTRLTVQLGNDSVSIKFTQGVVIRSFASENVAGFREAIISLFDEGEARFSINSGCSLVFIRPEELQGKAEVWLVGQDISREEARNVFAKEEVRKLRQFSDWKVA